MSNFLLDDGRSIDTVSKKGLNIIRMEGGGGKTEKRDDAYLPTTYSPDTGFTG